MSGGGEWIETDRYRFGSAFVEIELRFNDCKMEAPLPRMLALDEEAGDKFILVDMVSNEGIVKLESS
jgi:hypothetical protein